MLIALVDPRYNRVCQVVENGKEFPVAPPLFWEDCPDDVVADKFEYDEKGKNKAEKFKAKIREEEK